MNDQLYMKRVLKLADKGTGKVSPNPRVGAIIVKHGKILSEGYHAFFGGPHAEVAALSGLTPEKCRNSTLYVNLEPCDHHGKTPPCTDVIINSGIRRVVVGSIDPNPIVNGRGIEKLKAAGIETKMGVLEANCIRMNAAYFKFIQHRKPYITLKIAQTLDGKIATLSGQSRWISSEASRRWVHRLRNENDAILVGINTVILDDPELTVRMVPGHEVRKFVLDSTLRIPMKSRVLANPPNATIVTTSRAQTEKIKKLQDMGVHVWVLPMDENGRISLPSLWKKMTEAKITSVLVEGGKQLSTGLLNSGDPDRIVLFIAPKLFGEGIDAFGELGVSTPDGAFTFNESIWHRKGPDIVFEGRW